MMEDSDLAAIRQKRMSEMRSSASGSSNPSSGLPPMPQQEDAKKQQAEEMRTSMLTQILNPQARERLSRISIVKAEKARAVEDMIIRMVQSGQIRGKVTESVLIDILGQINEQTVSKIQFSRRRMDSDEEDDFGL